MQIFLTNSNKERDQSLVHLEITIQEIVKNPSRGVHHLDTSIHQAITPKIIFKRERYQKFSSIEKISATSLLTMGEL
jgi:hypothetical protein